MRRIDCSPANPSTPRSDYRVRQTGCSFPAWGGPSAGSRRSQRREIALLNREVDSHLAQLPPYQERLAQPRVEVVLEHRRARVQQVAIGKSFQLGGPHERQLFAGGYVPNEARSVG